MRLARLGLTHYGRFTNFTLDFGAADAGGPDLHLIYGPNEAGKSTILSGLIEFLFGMAPQTPYNFLHSYDALRLDADVEFDAGARALTRIKKPRNSLLDADGGVVPESVFGQLQDIGREGYRAMFSLDETTLEAGAKDLKAAKGDFGEILFGASAGLGQVTARLEAMRDAAKEIHLRGSGSKILNTLKKEIDRLARERDEADVTAAEYEASVGAREAARAAAESADAEAKAARAAHQRLLRFQTGLRAYGRANRARRKLAELPDIPPAPLGWPEDAARLAENDRAVRTQLQDAATALDGLERERAMITPDADVLALADRIEALADMAARHRTAEKDLPGREQEARDAAEDAKAAAARLGMADVAEPAELCLPSPLIGRISALLAERQAAVLKHDAAEREFQAAEAARGGGALVSPEGAARLAAALQAAETSTAVFAAADAKQKAETSGGRLADGLAALAPWTGDADALHAQAPPSVDQLAAWTRARDAADDRLREAKATVGHAKAARLEARQATAQACADTAVADDAAFANLRAERDALWRAHLSALDMQSAAAFAAAAETVDAAADARLANAGGLARLRQSAVDLEKATLAVDAAVASLKEAEADSQTLNVEIGRAGERLGLAGDISLPDLKDWLRRRQEALLLRAEAMKEADAARAHAAEAARVRTGLADALVGVDAAPEGPADLATLKTLAQDALAAAKARAEAQAALETRRAALVTARDALDAWRAKWAAALEGKWLARHADAPDAVQSALGDLNALDLAVQARDGFLRQVKGMRRDQDAFRQALADLLAALAVTFADDPGAEWKALQARLADAQRTAEQAATLDARIEAARAARDTRKTELERHDAAVAEMTARYGVATLADVRAAMQVAEERASLTTQAEEAEQDSRDAAGVATLEAAAAALADQTEDDLAAEVATAAAKADDLETAAREADYKLRSTDDDVNTLAGDATAATLEQQRQTALVAAADAARRHLRLRLGALAAERALQRFRRRHQSRMLARASETFATISRGSFSGLTTQPGVGAKETLVALRPGGASAMEDTGMSVGTRAQLYLSLRVAAYHELAAGGADLPPFVADDILETFDDDRAAETFAVLADMAQLGQVIYLTHHAHLIEIARKAAPGIRLHTLPDPVGGG